MAVLTPSAATASTEQAGFEAANAIDGVISSASGDRWAASTNSGWLRLDMGSAVSIDYYMVAPGQFSSNQDPAAWTFEGSADGSSWTTLDTKSGQTFSGAPRAFAVTGTYRYYRINVSNTLGGAGNVVSIAELQVGTAAGETSVAETVVGTGSGTGTTVTANIATTPSASQAVVVSLIADKTSTVTGLGATWTKVRDTLAAADSTSTHTIWIGTGATSSGTVTATAASNITAQMLVAVVNNLGTSAPFALGSYSAQRLAANGQIVIGGVYERGGGNAVISGSSVPASGTWNVLTRHDPTGSIRINQAWRVNASETAHNLLWSGLSVAGADQAIIGVPNIKAVPAPEAAVPNPAKVTATGLADASVPNPATVTATVSGPGAAVPNPAAVAASAIPTASVPNPATVTAIGPDTIVAAAVPNPATVSADSGATAAVPAPATVAASAIAEAAVGNPAAIGARVDDLIAAHSVTETTAAAAAPFTADPISAHSITETTSTISAPYEVDYISAHSVTEASSHAVPLLVLALEPDGRPQYRLIVVDSHGTPLGELENAVIGDPVQRLKTPGSFTASLPNYDPKASLLDVGAQVQVWAGAEMLPGAWFVLVQPGKDGSGQISYDFASLEALLDNVVIGTERPELLRNGGFEDGMKHWHATWLAGSAAEAPPQTTIVTGAAAKEGGKALLVEAVESVNVREVKTAAIFYGNRPYASEPLAAGFLPGGEQIIRDQLSAFSKGTALLVEGFTADVDGGDGQELSERRADAAKAVILAARPDLVVTAVGRGEEIQVAPNNTPENQAKNRRIVLTGTATRVGHRQIVNQWFTWRNTSRVPIELELDGWIDLIDYVGPSKDRYGFYINRRKASAPHKIVQAEHTDLPEDFPHERWTPDGTSAMIAPPDNLDYIYEVRLYGSAGSTKFDEISVKPNLRTGFYNATRPELFEGLVIEAQNVEHGKVDLNLETNCRPWGVRDDYEYEWKTPRTVWDAISEQLRADDAPDFGIVTTQTRRIATTWARRGRRSPVQFRLGDIVTDYTAGVDGDRVATTGIVTSNRSRGPGVAEARVRTAAVNGLVFERVQAAEPDRSRARLRQMGAAMTRYGRTDVLTSVKCDPEWTIYLLGHVGLGDVAWFDVHDGDTNVEGWYRIVEVRHSIAQHQMSYELVPEV